MIDLLCPLLAQQDGGGLGGMLPILLIVGLIFYFIVIRPGSKERKQREAQLKSLKKHDKVITNAGIHGSIVALDDDSVTLRVDDKSNVRIKFTRQAVWQVVSQEDEKAMAGSKSEK